MNFYTVAAKMDKDAKRYALQTIKQYDHAKANGIPIPDINYDDLYEQELGRLTTEFDRICNLGVDLMSRFSSKIKTINDNNGDRWYFVTVRPPHDTPWENFKSDCEAYCGKWQHKWLECVYVYEQKGEDEITMGHGFHWHMRFATNTINYYPSHILRDLFKQFPYVAKNCIKVETVKSLERCIEYMQGDKHSEEKAKAVAIDKLWREQSNIPAEVKYKARQNQLST